MLLIYLVRGQPVFPAEVDGLTGNVEMQSFSLDPSGNLAFACLSSDLSYVAISNANVIFYWSKTSP